MPESKKEFDDLEAVKSLVKALENFNDEERKRIIRWACEKLGAIYEINKKPEKNDGLDSGAKIPEKQKNETGVMDIKKFIELKDPKNDTHFAAVVAYYYRFEAPEGQIKDSIDSRDLTEAARLASRKRLSNPVKTLNNAYNQSGILDQIAHGKYKINTVGENLVAMVLPGGGGVKKVKKVARKRLTKKSAKKK